MNKNNNNKTNVLSLPTITGRPVIVHVGVYIVDIGEISITNMVRNVARCICIHELEKTWKVSLWTECQNKVYPFFNNVK